MKLVSAVVILLLLSNIGYAQQFEISSDKNGSKIFKGIISREALQADSSFTWYANGLKGYNPNNLALGALKQYGDSVQIISFMGTWCEDSHYIIPRFFSLLDAAGFSKDKVTLIGVDRDKKTLSHLAEALNVKNVPTLIVLKDGKELGRVVEYGKTGIWDKELGEIITAAFQR